MLRKKAWYKLQSYTFLTFSPLSFATSAASLAFFS